MSDYNRERLAERLRVVAAGIGDDPYPDRDHAGRAEEAFANLADEVESGGVPDGSVGRLLFVVEYLDDDRRRLLRRLAHGAGTSEHARNEESDEDMAAEEADVARGEAKPYTPPPTG